MQVFPRQPHRSPAERGLYIWLLLGLHTIAPTAAACLVLETASARAILIMVLVPIFMTVWAAGVSIARLTFDWLNSEAQRVLGRSLSGFGAAFVLVAGGWIVLGPPLIGLVWALLLGSAATVLSAALTSQLIPDAQWQRFFRFTEPRASGIYNLAAICITAVLLFAAVLASTVLIYVDQVPNERGYGQVTAICTPFMLAAVVVALLLQLLPGGPLMHVLWAALAVLLTAPFVPLAALALFMELPGTYPDNELAGTVMCGYVIIVMLGTFNFALYAPATWERIIKRARRNS